MAEKNYPVNEAIPVVFKAAGAQTGKTVQMDVYDEAGVKDVAQSVALIERVDGLYGGAFTPDAEGEWVVAIYEAGKAKDKVIQGFSVGQYNVHDVGAAIGNVAADVDAISLMIEDLSGPPMIG